jgi:flagellar biosynthetic protein FliR
MVDYTFSVSSFEYFLVILVRVSAFMFVAPFFSQSGIVPARVKAGLSFFVALLLYTALPQAQLEYSTEIGFSIIVLKEGITGVLIGFAANICNSIVLFTGRMIDMEIGLSMANVFDPMTNSQVSVTGNLYNYLVLLLLLVSDMDIFLLQAVKDSYEVIPVGQTLFDSEQFYEALTTFMTDYMVIGFRIFLPVFICIMMLNVILGIMAKVSPQMNMFAVGIQLKVMVGLAVLFVTVPLLPNISDFIFTEVKKMMTLFMEGLY